MSEEARNWPTVSKHSAAEIAEYVAGYRAQGITFADLADVYLYQVDRSRALEEERDALKAQAERDAPLLAAVRAWGDARVARRGTGSASHREYLEAKDREDDALYDLRRLVFAEAVQRAQAREDGERRAGE